MENLSMSHRHHLQLLPLFALLCLLPGQPLAAAPAMQPAPAFKAGFAERDITPDIGMEQPGNYMKAFHRVIHDPCKVRAAVFDDGQSKIALVGIDALIIRRPSVQIARQAIAEKCAIPPRSILIGATHTHEGGPTGMVLPGEYDQASDLVKSLAYEKSSCADAKYLARVEQAIVEAVVEANEHRQDARAAAGFGIEDTVAFNRRFRMKDGITFTHPGQGNTDIVAPAGPTDPQVGALGVWDANGKLLGCIVNYACHATTGPGGASADYIYYLESTIRGLLGQQAIIIFLPGAAADVTQVNNRSPYQVRQSGEDNSRLVGGRIGAEALKVLLSSQASAGALLPLASQTRTLQIKRRIPSPEHLAKAMELVKQPPSKGQDQTDWLFAKETILLDAMLKKEPVANVEIQALQIGPALFLACPAEYFCQFGLDIKHGSKFPFTFPVSLANDCVGYVPTEDAFGPTGGGYETRLTSYTNLEVRAGRMMADGLIGLSSQLTPGPIPQPPALPPFKGKPWGYGNRPPQVD
jgi:hypothetical protein